MNTKKIIIKVDSNFEVGKHNEYQVCNCLEVIENEFFRKKQRYCYEKGGICILEEELYHSGGIDGFNCGAEIGKSFEFLFPDDEFNTKLIDHLNTITHEYALKEFGQKLIDNNLPIVKWRKQEFIETEAKLFYKEYLSLKESLWRKQGDFNQLINDIQK